MLLFSVNRTESHLAQSSSSELARTVHVTCTCRLRLNVGDCTNVNDTWGVKLRLRFLAKCSASKMQEVSKNIFPTTLHVQFVLQFLLHGAISTLCEDAGDEDSPQGGGIGEVRLSPCGGVEVAL